MASEKLKLMALDGDDLTIIATYCQDAVFKVDDITWLAKEKRFLIRLNRFIWEKVKDRRQFLAHKSYERRNAVLHFDQVDSVQTKGIDATRHDLVFSLLSIDFEPDDNAVTGHVDIILANHCAIRLKVRCLEARLSDLQGAWQTKNRPQHDH